MIFQAVISESLAIGDQVAVAGPDSQVEHSLLQLVSIRIATRRVDDPRGEPHRVQLQEPDWIGDFAPKIIGGALRCNTGARS